MLPETAEEARATAAATAPAKPQCRSRSQHLPFLLDIQVVVVDPSRVEDGQRFCRTGNVETADALIAITAENSTFSFKHVDVDML